MAFDTQILDLVNSTFSDQTAMDGWAADGAKEIINMRTTWSGQTKVEFTQTTMSEDIAKRNKR